MSYDVVALRKESVDRNVNLRVLDGSKSVALRKESVDRNKYVVQCRKVMGVALRKESVDRNFDVRYTASPRPRSLSARRAWIEMGNSSTQSDPAKCRSPQGERG